MDWSSKLNISITDPLFSGELIYGNKYSFESIRKRILNQNITKEAIEYNIQETKKIKPLTLKNIYSMNKHQSKIIISHSN